MNIYYDYLKTNINAREGAFKKVLQLIGENPLIALEIGATGHDFDNGGMHGMGWSSFYWCEHILKYGGRLDIVDIEPKTINKSKEILSDFLDKIEINHFIDNGINKISEEYNFIYIDGADNPQEALDQFNKINRKNTIILCDDFHHIKGSLIRKHHPDFAIIKANQTHELAIFEKI
jgi:hypothetical protein